MNINQLNAEKKIASDKIIIYQSLLSKISNINSNLDNCRNDLLISSDYLAEGLIVESTPADNGKIVDIATQVLNGMNKLNNVSTLVTKKIKELQEMIVLYDRKIKHLEELEAIRKKTLLMEDK